MSDKLITLDLLKKFGGTCKTSFQEAPITVSGDSNIIQLQFNVSINGFYLTCLDIKGIGEKGYLDSKIIYHIDNHVVINNGNIAIEDAVIDTTSSTSSFLYLALSDSVKNIHVLSSVTRGNVVYKALTGVYLPNIPILPSLETHLTNIIYAGNSEKTTFSIKDAFGEDQEYEKDVNFSSIFAAGKLANTFDFELATESDGGKGQDFDTNGSRIIQIPWREYKAGKGVSISKDYEISSTASSSIATKDDLGVVKIGNGINITEDGIISAQEIGAATTSKAGTIMLGADSDSGKKLPLRVDSEGRAYVSAPDVHRFHIMPKPSLELSGALYQYIGETTSEFTKGYFYNCLPITRINFVGFGVLDGANPAYQLMHYLQDKTYDSGENIDFSTFFSKAYNVKFENDCWKIYDDEVSLSIPDSDLSIIGLYCKNNDYFKNAGEMEKALTFVNSGENYSWVQKDVQPIGYLNNEDLSFMTDEDVDEIFAEKVEEIKVYNSSSEQEIPEQFETTESEIYISVIPELVAYSSVGQVTIAKEEDSYKITIAGNGSILFQSVIYPDVTKTINIIKNEETV